MPVRSKQVCDFVYAVAVVSPRGDLATLYFARWLRTPLASIPLVLVDFDLERITSSTWSDIEDKLKDLTVVHKSRYPRSPGLWVESEALLVAALEAGTLARLVPPHLVVKAAWQELGLAAMVQVRGGNVKVADAVFARRDELSEAVPFGALKLDGGVERGDDATVPAMLYGIAVGLDLATAKIDARARAA